MISYSQPLFDPPHAPPPSLIQAFVIYDDARCRGADLHLRPNTVALLTLASTTTKDKLMQAAGRLRLLGRGQELSMVALPEVTAKVLSTNGMRCNDKPGVEQVLRWVMHNTCQATMAGILEWTRQGLFFAASKGRPDKAMVDEQLHPLEMYRGAVQPLPASEVAARLMQRQLVDKAGLLPEMEALMGEICEISVRHSEGHVVITGQAADEECEREMEQEEEEEEEAEMGGKEAVPAEEADWDYEAVLTALSPLQLSSEAGVEPIQSLIQKMRQDSGVDQVEWAAGLYVTSNFMATVQGGMEGQFLRPVSSLLLFPGLPSSPVQPEVLLVSEREEDALLELLWRTSATTGSGSLPKPSDAPVLLRLPYASAFQEVQEKAGDASPVPPPRLACSVLAPTQQLAAIPAQQALMSLDALVSLRLFNAETVYASISQRKVLHKLMRRKVEVAEELVQLRGKEALLHRSHLEDACQDALFIS